MSDGATVLFAVGFGVILALIGIDLGESHVASECREKGAFMRGHDKYECQKLETRYVRPGKPSEVAA